MQALDVESELTRLSQRYADGRAPTLAEGRAYCRRWARAHYENFTVASWMLPRRLRQHFYHVYAYCRWADDLADETGGGGKSLELLDWWEGELLAMYAGAPRHPVMAALAETAREFNIPPDPFRQLLVAFRQDQTVHRYAARDELLDYCRSSANPVGRLVLYLGRCHDERRAALADCVCTGLQIANFCQDMRRDWERGRLYLVREIYEPLGCCESTLASGRFDAAWQQAVERHVDWAARLLRQGGRLVPLMPAELRLDVWLFVHGGLAILHKIRQQQYDVWRQRPTVLKRQQLGLLVRGWLQTRRALPWGRRDASLAAEPEGAR